MDGLHPAAEDSDEVDDRGGAIDRTPDAGWLGDVRLDESELADLAQRLDEIGVARIARGDTHPDALFEQEFADVAADEAVAAENRHQLLIPLDHRAPDRPAWRR